MHEKYMRDRQSYEAKITQLENALKHDKENYQDYLDIQVRRKAKIKDDEIADLKMDLEKSAGILREVRSNAANAESRINRSENEASQLKMKIIEFQQKLAESKSQNSHLQQASEQNRRLHDNLAELKSKFDASRREMENFKNENSQLKSRNEKMQKSLKDRDFQQEEHRVIYERETNDQIAQLKRQIDQLNIENQQLSSETANLQRKLDEQSRKGGSYQQKVSGLERQIDSYRDNDEKLRNQLRNVEISAQKDITAFAAEREKFEAELELQRMKTTKKDSEYSGLRAEISNLQNQLQSATSDLNEANNRCQTAENTAMSNAAQCQVLQDQLATHDDQFRQKMSSSEKELTKLTQKQNKIQAQNRELESALNKAEIENSKLRNEIESLRFESEEHFANEEAKAETRRHEAENVLNQLNEAREQINDAKQAKSSLLLSNQKLESELQLLGIQMVQINEDLESAKQKIQHLEDEKDEILQENDDLVRNDADEKSKSSELKKRLSNVEREFKTHIQQLEEDVNARDDKIGHLSDQNNQLQHEVQEWRDAAEVREQRLEKQKIDLEQIATENDENMDELRVAMDDLTNEKVTLQNLIRELEDNLEGLEDKNSQLEKRADEDLNEIEELSANLIEEKSKNTELEAKFNVEANLKSEMRQRIENLEDELDRIELEKETQVQKISENYQKASVESEEISAEMKQGQRRIERLEQEAREGEHQLIEFSRKIKISSKSLENQKRQNRQLEKENEGLEEKINSLVATLRKEQESKLADFEEMEKYRIGYEKTSGLIDAERQKNNQLKHENKELTLSETRLRTQNYQLIKCNELLHRQNEDLTPSKKKKDKNREAPKMFVPPPMYKELENQIEVLRKENAKMKAKMFGSNTDLDKMNETVIPEKPKRKTGRKTVNVIPINCDSFTAISPGICYASSMPIYVGDQIVERNGMKCHERYLDDFNRILTKSSKGEPDSQLKMLINEKWVNVNASQKGTSLIVRTKKSPSGKDELKIDLKTNLAIHGAVCFDHVNFMAEVDHELCFAVEEIDSGAYNYFCAKDLLEKQKWYYNIDLVLSRPKLPPNDSSKFTVKKLTDFSADSSGSFPKILASIPVGEGFLLGTSDALLMMQPSGDVVQIWSCPVYKLDANEKYVFFIRGECREFGFLRIDALKKIGKSDKETPLFVPLVSRNVHTFAVGKFQGKHGVSVAIENKIRTFIFSHIDEADEYDPVVLQQVPSSLVFTSTSIICGTDPIIEIDLRSGNTEDYLGPDELAKIYTGIFEEDIFIVKIRFFKN